MKLLFHNTNFNILHAIIILTYYVNCMLLTYYAQF